MPAVRDRKTEPSAARKCDNRDIPAQVLDVGGI
jgi:hypothetical protein